MVIIRQLYEYYEIKQVGNYAALSGTGNFSMEERSYRCETEDS